MAMWMQREGKETVVVMTVAVAASWCTFNFFIVNMWCR